MSNKQIWKEIFYLSIFFFVLLIFYPGASETQNANKEADRIEGGFLLYYERAYTAYPSDPQTALENAVKAQMLALYDIARVADASSHRAWIEYKENMVPIFKWGIYHPQEYQKDLKRAVKWGKAAKPPDYRPDWMIFYGKGRLLVQDEEIDFNPYREDLDSKKAWARTIATLEAFANDELTWDKLNEAVKPENAFKTLKSSANMLVREYGRHLAREDLDQIKSIIDGMLENFHTMKEPIPDRMFKISNEIEQIFL
ncbi:MAG: hypothetical protein K8S27_14590 [Candidatus Omnitrophica bacterium]|nr:hypothetical protein [Candidatus Omnitrophota bacterium]